MPPRWLTFAIIGFWLGTTGWMIYQQASLRRRAGEPPPFHIDLTDEVSKNTISWAVFLDDGEVVEHVGMGQSGVKRRPDRTFELQSEYRFNNNYNLLKKIHFKFKKLNSTFWVNGEGHLQGLTACVFLTDDIEKGDITIEGEISGRVEKGYFIPKVKVKVDQIETSLPFSEKFKIPEHGSILNPMHLINKIQGLREGQQWAIPLLNPLHYQDLAIPILEAEVAGDWLTWNNKEVLCFRIDYHEPGKKVTARTWVRQRDNVVLQQEAEHMGKKIILKRDK